MGIEAEQGQRGPLTGEVRSEQTWKEQGHMRRGVALECSIISAPFRMGMLPKQMEWGKNVREKRAMATIAGSFNSLRNWLRFLPTE